MATKSKAKEKASPAGADAIALLKADHKKVKGLFEEYKKLCESDAPDAEKADVAGEICMELTIHAQAEEDVFYPALREAGVEEDLMDEADVEHAGAKDLIAQISAMQPDEPHYDAKVTVLGEYIDHHVKEEEGEMFPKAKSADVDMDALGAALEARKTELKAEYDAEAGDDKAAAADDSEQDDPVGKVPAGAAKARAGNKKTNGAGANKSR